MWVILIICTEVNPKGKKTWVRNWCAHHFFINLNKTLISKNFCQCVHMQHTMVIFTLSDALIVETLLIQPVVVWIILMKDVQLLVCCEIEVVSSRDSLLLLTIFYIGVWNGKGLWENLWVCQCVHVHMRMCMCHEKAVNWYKGHVLKIVCFTSRFCT